MAHVKTYVRPMAGWWRRNPYFVRYMIRESSSVFLAIYALVLLVGLYRLTQGQAAWEGWLAAMTRPISLLFHWVALVTVGYHAYTWWKVAPKTAPDLHFRGKPLPAVVITGGGGAATIGASVVVYILVRWL